MTGLAQTVSALLGGGGNLFIGCSFFHLFTFSKVPVVLCGENKATGQQLPTIRLSGTILPHCVCTKCIFAAPCSSLRKTHSRLIEQSAEPPSESIHSDLTDSPTRARRAPLGAVSTPLRSNLACRENDPIAFRIPERTRTVEMSWISRVVKVPTLYSYIFMNLSIVHLEPNHYPMRSYHISNFH